MGKFLLSTLLLLTTAFASTAETKNLELTTSNFKFNGTSYSDSDYESDGIKISLHTTGSSSVFGMNKGKGSYIALTGNANNYKIVSVSIDVASSGNKGQLDVFKKNQPFTASTATTGVAAIGQAGLTSIYTISKSVNTTGGTVQIDDLAFAIVYTAATSGNQFTINKITITYESGDSSKNSADVAFPQNAYTFSIGESFESPVATKATTAELVYSSDNEEVATINASTGELTLKSEGTAVITAKAEENTEYNAGSASYTLTVIDPSIKVILDAPFTGNIDNLTLEGDGADKVWTYGGAIYGLKGTAYKINPAPTAPCYAVTPVINLAGYSEIKTTFKQAANYFDNTSNFQADCQIMIREVAIGEWTPIEMTGLPDGKSWTYVDSSIDLNAYAGKSIQIGFCYTNGKTGTWEIKDLLIKGKYTPVAPAKPEIHADCQDMLRDGNIIKDGNLKLAEVEGIDFWYKLEPNQDINALAEAADHAHNANGYTKYDSAKGIDITANDRGKTLTVFACDAANSIDSEPVSFAVNVATGVAEIEAAGAGEVRWFDMQGREVKGQPEKGIYVRVVNGKASKVIL